MSTAQDDQIITSWLRLQGVDRESDDYENLLWSEIELSRMAREDPHRLWRLILRILERDHSDKVIGSLSSGVMEELLSEHGQDFVDVVEEQAHKDKTFAHLLGGVWQGDMSDDIWERVQRVASAKW